jgi:predicted site-specific integrase-resolvase
MGLTLYLLLLEHETMIISIAYAKRLIKSGKATIVATVTHDGVEYYVINRHDLQRTDHAEVPA